jgi:hypothetical protein
MLCDSRCFHLLCKERFDLNRPLSPAVYLLVPIITVWAIGQVNFASAQTWPRHVIDDSFRGADGDRLCDFDRDGFFDVVTGWEESGVVRLYRNPGPTKEAKPWPAVTIGKAGSPEDAVQFDIDGDGKLEVISCHEGKTQRVYVHRHLFDFKKLVVRAVDTGRRPNVDARGDD